MQSGEAALKTAATLAGLLPDSLSEGARQVSRWTLPLDDTPISALKYLIAHYGLPVYEGESYAETLARLRDAWDIHVRAGSLDMLITELERAGLIGPTITHDDSGAPLCKAQGQMYIEAYNIGPNLTWGDFVYGDGSNYGGQVDPPVARNVQRVLKWYKPARTTLIDFRQRTSPLLHAWRLDETHPVQGAEDHIGSANGVHGAYVEPGADGPTTDTVSCEYFGLGTEGTDLGESAFTFDQDDYWQISYWCKTETDDGVIVGQRDGGGNGLEVYHGSDVPRIFLRGTLGNVLVYATAASALTDNTWHHVLWHWDGSEEAAALSLYFDGQPAGVSIITDTMSAGGTILAAGQHGTLGARWDTDAADSNVFEGQLWDVAIFGFEDITQAEVTTIYEGGLAGISSVDLFSYVT